MFGAVELVSVDEGAVMLDVAVPVDDSEATALEVPDPGAVDAVDFALLLGCRDPELLSVVRVADCVALGDWDAPTSCRGWTALASDVTDRAHNRPNRTAYGMVHLARMLHPVDY